MRKPPNLGLQPTAACEIVVPPRLKPGVRATRMAIGDPIFERMRATLTDRRVRGVESYWSRLESNAGTPEVLWDLLAEAQTAATLAGSGFLVVLRDAPDLHVSIIDVPFAVEVKRFRRKPQDDIDEAWFAKNRGMVRPYGDTIDTEGAAVVDQLLSVAATKAAKLPFDRPTVLAIHSASPHCVEDLEVRDAASRLYEAQCHGGDVRWAGIMFFSRSTSCIEHRNLYFFETAGRPSLPKSVATALNEIREWRAP